MVYIDTSVLVAYYCPERLSEKAEGLLMGYLRPAISSLTEVELFSAVSGKVRKKEINLRDAGRVTARFLAHMDADNYTYTIIVWQEIGLECLKWSFEPSMQSIWQ
jgi:predicted nucleic acid-binding protein